MKPRRAFRLPAGSSASSGVSAPSASAAYAASALPAFPLLAALSAFLPGLVLLVLLTLAGVTPRPAMASEGATRGQTSTMGLPAAVIERLPGAQLRGEGDMRWFGLRVYRAQLWSAPSASVTSPLPRSAFALQLHYALSLSGQAIADKSLEEIERMGFGDPVRRREWHAAMSRLFPDVGRDDRLIGLHLPGQGVSFFHGDRFLGQVEDADFAEAFFSIWLDERTTAPGLRRALLNLPGRG